MIKYSHFTSLLLFAFLFAFWGSGCDTLEEQKQFVRDSEEMPSGITRILASSSGQTVCSVDEDDWRIAPFRQGLIRIENGGALPNPASGTLVTIEVTILLPNRIGGILELLTVQGNRAYTLGNAIVDVSSPGLHVFQFSTSELGTNGLHRVFIFESGVEGGLVSYGDIEVVAQPPTSC